MVNAAMKRLSIQTYLFLAVLPAGLAAADKTIGLMRHDPSKAWGFVGVVISVEDLSGSIFVWHRQDEDWVKDLMRLDELGHHADPTRLAVYAMGEATDEKADFTSARAAVIQAQVSQAEAELRAFADALPAGAA